MLGGPSGFGTKICVIGDENLSSALQEDIGPRKERVGAESLHKFQIPEVLSPQ